jgi:RHS repeat-associated protein
MDDPNLGPPTIFTPNHLNQYTSVTGRGALTYDGNLNMSGYDGWAFVHDAEKRLLAVTGNGHSAQFVYDGLGRCVKRTIDGATTLFTYDGWKPVAEWTGAGVLVAWNLYGAGPDEILVRYQQDPEGYLHYHLDAMGNVQFLLSDRPEPGLEKYTYDVFGKPTIKGWNGDGRPISNHGNRFLFTGREYLYTFGLYDYRHRIYHPGLGRFIETDPLGQQIEGAKLSVQQTAMYALGGTAPEKFGSSELNLYRYCHNNPINHSDPFGLVPPGDGLIDLPRKTVGEIKEAMKGNTTRTLTEKSPDFSGGKPRSQEHRTMAYDNDKGERKTSTETGRHENGIYPYTDKPKNPFKDQPATPAWDSHSHISGSGKPYLPRDITSADYLRVPSGVQSATGGPLYIYVPSATPGGQGGLFRVEGARLINEATGLVAPH